SRRRHHRPGAGRLGSAAALTGPICRGFSMNFKTTYILFGGLVLLLAAAAVSLLTGPKAGEEGKLVTGIDAKDVTKVIVERKQPAESRLVFVRVDKDRWKLEQPYDAAVDGRQVDSLVSDV